jgi:tetratricopeptide (TPR) repeat protein
MKLVHHNKDNQPETNWLEAAIHHEREGEFDMAVKAYHKLLEIHPHKAEIYNKLMRIHRDLKQYDKELTVINKAIKSFEKYYKDQKPSYNPKITSLSKALLKATGLADKKGNNIYQPAELARWKKRKITVEKRLGKTK